MALTSVINYFYAQAEVAGGLAEALDKYVSVWVYIICIHVTYQCKQMHLETDYN